MFAAMIGGGWGKLRHNSSPPHAFGRWNLDLRELVGPHLSKSCSGVQELSRLPLMKPHESQSAYRVFCSRSRLRPFLGGTQGRFSNVARELLPTERKARVERQARNTLCCASWFSALDDDVPCRKWKVRSEEREALSYGLQEEPIPPPKARRVSWS